MNVSMARGPLLLWLPALGQDVGEEVASFKGLPSASPAWGLGPAAPYPPLKAWSL